MDEHNHEREVTDPVCGMRIAPDAEIQFEHRGVIYRFCDKACAETFRDDPERWVGDGKGEGFIHSHHH